MDILNVKCSGCGASVEVDLDNLKAFCPYCGSKLQMNIEDLSSVLIKREETKQKKEELEYQERKEIRERKEERKDEWQGMAILFAMIAVSCFIVWLLFH